MQNSSINSKGTTGFWDFWGGRLGPGRLGKWRFEFGVFGLEAFGLRFAVLSFRQEVLGFRWLLHPLNPKAFKPIIVVSIFFSIIPNMSPILAQYYPNGHPKPYSLQCRVQDSRAQGLGVSAVGL